MLHIPIIQQSESPVGFETGSFCLYVEPGSSSGPVFKFSVTDLQAAKQALIKAGCRVVGEDLTLPRCYLRDPFGLIFNLSESRVASS